MAKLRFITDSGHGWLEVPTVDVTKAGVMPSKYSYINADTSMTYLEEDCDATAYLKAIGTIYLEDDMCEDVYIDGLCWVRDLPRRRSHHPALTGSFPTVNATVDGREGAG